MTVWTCTAKLLRHCMEHRRGFLSVDRIEELAAEYHALRVVEVC